MIVLAPPLKARVDAILAKLAVLSDAPTQKMSKAPTDRLKVEAGHWGYGGKNRQAFEGNMPPGVRDIRSKRLDPEKDCLLDWFVIELGLLKHEHEVEALVLEAEMRHGNVINATRPRPFGAAGAPETTKTRDKRIRDRYHGLTPEQVAPIERVRAGVISPENVRRVRLAGDLDPETGHELPSEVFLDVKGKRAWAIERYANGEGMAVTEIARRLRVATSTVSEWLGNRKRRDRAA